MDFLFHIGLILLILAIIFTPMFGLYYLIKLFWDTFIENAGKYYHSNIDNQTIALILEQKQTYYQKLQEDEKQRFIKRTKQFIQIKEFHGSGGLEVTDEMIVLISASAIQLTFGLSEYLLIHFSKIFIYPKEYYSKYDKLYHKGEANLAGAIAFSWFHFKEGYEKPKDNLNLGLHEMAHALRFDKFKSDSYDSFFSDYFDKWHMVSKDEFLRLKDHQPSFFREYGGTNVNEFFSVCVEYFFESPAEFLKAQPEMYKHLSILLNQDPLYNRILEPISEFNTEETLNDLNMDEPILFQSSTTPKNILAVLFAIFCWFSLLKKTIEDTDNVPSILLTITLPIIGYFVFNEGFKKIYFYSNGVRIKYLLPNFFGRNGIYSYSKIILIEFSEGETNDIRDSLEVRVLEDHRKTKTYSFSADFYKKEVQQLADVLVKKKVAVKLNSFEY